MLGAIGLDPVQEAVYRALVGLGAAESPELAHRLDLPEAESVEILRRLEKQGLAAESPTRPGRWLAVPPAVALGALLARQREGLERAERAAAGLVETYGTVPGTTGTAPDADGPRDAPPTDDGPDATDLRMLSLLLAGLTDASVAKQLDLGLRTVQRRVKRLMELAGVSTRLQLGWHARDRGWLKRAAPGAGAQDPRAAPRQPGAPAPPWADGALPD